MLQNISPSCLKVYYQNLFDGDSLSPLTSAGALHLNSGGFNQRDTFSSPFEHYSFTSQSQPVTRAERSVPNYFCDIQHQLNFPSEAEHAPLITEGNCEF